MSICRGCGKSVGCGCQLKDGLCVKCRTIPPVIEKKKGTQPLKTK